MMLGDKEALDGEYAEMQKLLKHYQQKNNDLAKSLHSTRMNHQMKEESKHSKAGDPFETQSRVSKAPSKAPS